MAKSHSRLLIISKAAGCLKLSMQLLYHPSRHSGGQSQPVGRHWRFHKAAIDKWLGQRRKQKG